MGSENGWEPARLPPDSGELEWITVPGSDNVHLQLMKGAPLVIMRAYAADYNHFVEPLRDADSAAYTPTNPVATSNHLNATAMDLNWDSHPFRVADAGYTPEMIGTMNELLDFYEGTMFWANLWDDPKDSMHHQMGYDTWNNAHTRDFINRKIRVDGYSTFRRGDLPAPPPGMTQADQYAAVIIDVGRGRGISERGQKIAIATALVETNLKNYANSNVPESMNIPHDAVGSDHDSVGLFQQRCPMWGPAAVLMDPAASANLFYDHLVQLDYNSTDNSPGFYAQSVQRSAFPDRYDERFDDACEIYNRVVGATPPPGPEPAPPAPDSPRSDEMTPDQAAQLADIWHAMFDRQASKSRYGDPNIKWYPKDYWLNDDGLLYDLWVENNARLGDPEAIAQIRKAASGGDRIAARFLADLFTTPVTPPPPAPAPHVEPTPAPPPVQPAPFIPPIQPSPPPLPPQSENGAGESTSLAGALADFKDDINRLIG